MPKSKRCKTPAREKKRKTSIDLDRWAAGGAGHFREAIGYGARDSKPAIGVHDAIMAKALLISKGDLKFVIVTADVLGFPPQFKAAVVSLTPLASLGKTKWDYEDRRRVTIQRNGIIGCNMLVPEISTWGQES